MLISEDKKKVSFSLVEMQIYSDANYRPYPIFDDKVVMDKYNLDTQFWSSGRINRLEIEI